jgi:oligogalacturonide lyase
VLRGASSDKGRVLPSEARIYADPATEFPVQLMTDPAFASFLPNPYCRAIARRGAFVLFASDRGAGPQAFRLELKTGELKQLTDAQALMSASLNILPDDKTFCYLDGRTVKLTPFSSLRDRDVYTIPEGWEAGDGFSISVDGVYAALVERKGSRSRLQLIGLARGTAQTLQDIDGVIRHPQPRPKRASVLYQREDSLWLVNYDGQANQRLCQSLTGAGAAQWSPDGRTVLYLSEQDKRVTMREVTPDTRQERAVAPTTQFAGFASNPDGTVLVGASRSLASPYVLALIRSVRRELTLCEHKASNPEMVSPIWSPTSQRIYFQSDRHGKPAIYSVVVAGFIEKTNLDGDDPDEKPKRPSQRKQPGPATA